MKPSGIGVAANTWMSGDPANVVSEQSTGQAVWEWAGSMRGTLGGMIRCNAVLCSKMQCCCNFQYMIILLSVLL